MCIIVKPKKQVIIPLDNYTSRGFIDREQYLECLASEYDIDLDVVISLSELLGMTEDFDGLIAALNQADVEGNF